MGIPLRWVFGFLVITSWCPRSILVSAQSIPPEYQRFFVQRADQLSRFEKAFNLIGKTSFPVGRSFALIAGVTQYPNFPELDRSLKPAEVDIEKMQAYLKEQEFFDEIVVLKDGDMTLENLNYFLENYFPQRLAQSPHSRFLFAYSGHGYSIKTGAGTTGYLLTSSATGFTDPVNRVGLDVLRTMFNPVIDSAEKVLVLINSCESGAFWGRRGYGASPLEPGEKAAEAITASRSEQESLALDSVGPGSVFFEKIIAGLGGPADKSPTDGVVTFHELATYLLDEIRYATNGKQNPVDGDISRNGSVGEFFFLNRNRQISFGNAPPWNPKDAVAFGVPDQDVLRNARQAFRDRRIPEAVQLFTQAAGAGNGEAMNRMGYFCEMGTGVPKDYAQAHKWFEGGAAAGNGDAMYNLGLLYDDGWGVARDYVQARTWFEKAAASGVPYAMAELGDYYQHGTGVSQDYEQAVRWYEKSAAAGYENAMMSLAYVYEEGNVYDKKSVPQDYEQARQWFEKAAATGDTLAMDHLATLYQRGGHGLAQDHQKAREWLQKAADAGNTGAKNRLQMGYF